MIRDAGVIVCNRLDVYTSNMGAKGDFHENPNLFAGCATACGFPGHAARSAFRRKQRSWLVVRLTSPGARILEGCKQRRATSRSTVAVSADGAVLERQHAG